MFLGYLSGKYLIHISRIYAWIIQKKIEAAILFEVIPRIIIAALFCKSFQAYFIGILFIRFWWRPPSNCVEKNSVRIMSASSVLMKRPGITRILASLC